jgi:UDP-3-O-acyl-N-acetylglucosamine deacetylase
MGALYGMGIDNALVELDNEEVPILDGSAKVFIEEINKVEKLFNNHQILINKIICSNYAKEFDSINRELNICEIGYKLNQGLNKQEVKMIPKKIEKKGFFERLFHLFN